MKAALQRLVMLGLLAAGLYATWLPDFDAAAVKVVDDGLQRAMITFASARAINAFLSVVQTAQVSATPFGVGATLTLGQVLHPINQLVDQFAELMLTASVVFGIMKLLIAIGSHKVIAGLLSATAVGWVAMRGSDSPARRPLTQALILLILIRFSIPVMTVGSEEIFQRLFVDDYNSASAAIAQIPATADGWWKEPAKAIDDAKAKAELWVRHIIDLIVLFCLQTIVAPIILFWIFHRGTASFLEPELPSVAHRT